MGKALVVLLLLGSRAEASDMGTPVSFQGRSAMEAFQAQPFSVKDAAGLRIGPSSHVGEPFDTVLFQGDDLEPGTIFEVSRAEASGDWSPWVFARVKRFEGGRFWARAEFKKASAGALRVRISVGGGPVEVSPTVYSFEVFLRGEAMEEGRGSNLGAPYQVLVGTPPAVLAREAWRAKPPKEDYSPHVPQRLTQHHTAGRWTDSLESSAKELAVIQDFHQNGRGWNDIGYHFLIDGAGRIFQGRPVDAVGAHVRDHNAGNIGVSLLGSYHPPRSDALSPAQRESLAALGSWLREAYGVEPRTYLGHRDYNHSTECPGEGVYSQLDSIRDSFSAP